MDRLDPPVHASRQPGRDPVTIVGLATVGLTVSWLGTATVPVPVAARIGWAVSLACFGAVALMCRQAAVRAEGDARRLWHLLAGSAAVTVAGYATQLAAAPSGTVGVKAPAAAGLFGVGTLVVAVALARFPLPGLSRSTYRQVRFEAGIVAVAAGVVGWNVSAAGWGPSDGGWTRLAEPALIIITTYGITRIALTRRLPGRGLPGLLWLLSYVLLAAADAQAGRWLGSGHAGWYPAADVVAAGMVFMATRLLILGRDRPRSGPGETDRLRRSVLPYVALGTTFAVLVAVQLSGSDRAGELVAVLGAVVSAGLVTLRHRAAVAETEDLACRLAEALTGRDDLAATLERMAFSDPLTGVANRARFTDHLAAAQAEAARMGTSVAVLLIDLDDFKPVNDRYGHAAGDAVLRECAARVAGCLRGGDLLARIGGDEFAVVLRQSYKLSATAVAERIVEELRRPIVVNAAVTARVGVSVGVAADTGGRRTPDALMHVADAAMYHAKGRGKGAVSIG